MSGGRVGRAPGEAATGARVEDDELVAGPAQLVVVVDRGVGALEQLAALADRVGVGVLGRVDEIGRGAHPLGDLLGQGDARVVAPGGPRRQPGEEVAALLAARPLAREAVGRVAPRLEDGAGGHGVGRDAAPEPAAGVGILGDDRVGAPPAAQQPVVGDLVVVEHHQRGDVGEGAPDRGKAVAEVVERLRLLDPALHPLDRVGHVPSPGRARPQGSWRRSPRPSPA